MWSASIDVPAKTRQDQVVALASYPIPLNKTEKPNAVYRDEPESSAPKAPCTGETNYPVAEAGFLCVLRGGEHGTLESEDHNAKFFGFAQAQGSFQSTPTAKEGSRDGELILFRTEEFEEEAPFIEELVKPANLSAAGGWAITALK